MIEISGYWPWKRCLVDDDAVRTSYTYSSCVASQAESTELQITDVTVIVGHENLWKALLFFDHEIVQKHQGIFLFYISRPFIYLQRVSYHRSRFVLICHM